jgi:transcription termination factor NusB
LYYLRPEDKKRLLEKVNRLLNEHKIEEACRLMVAIAFVNMDADTFVNGLLDEIKKYQVAHRRA